jgi:hypothetical protein
MFGRSFLTAVALLCTVVFLFMSALPASVVINRAGATNLIIYNASNKDATVQVKLPTSGVGDGCPVSVRQIRIVDAVTGRPIVLTPFGTDAVGWFILKRGAKAQLINNLKNPYTGKLSSCLQGFNITFNAAFACPDSLGGGNSVPNTVAGPSFNQPVTPTPPLPNGSNAFEGSLNMPGTSGGAFFSGALNEAIDISCVNGANSTLVCTVTPPAGGPYWSVLAGARGGGNLTLTRAFTTRNSWVDVANECDANCVDPATGFARPGVYPFGCTQCNVFPDIAPPCGGKQYCAAKNGAVGNNGCGFARGPRNVQSGSNPPQPTFGGTVQVTYLGPLSPPGTCPPGTKN